MKALFIAAAASFMAAPALAGPYVNIENNAGFVGNDYQSAVTETHIGFEGDIGENSAFYVQGGPAFISPDGEDSTTELSGKVGVVAAVTDTVELYGEVALRTAGEIDLDEDLNVGTKLGMTYRF